MESWQIFVGLITPVLGYLVLSNIQQGKQIAVMSKQLDTITMQLNLFLKSEVDTLKDIARSVSR